MRHACSPVAGWAHKGKAKEAAGTATGNEELRAEGQDDQTRANVKQAGEKAKDAWNDATR